METTTIQEEIEEGSTGGVALPPSMANLVDENTLTEIKQEEGENNITMLGLMWTLSIVE